MENYDLLEELDDFPYCLIGKFFTNSAPPSLEETESSLWEQWPKILPENITVRTQNNDPFLFDFKQKEDKEFVLLQGPWIVNGVMLVIKEFSSEVIDFTVTDLWVSVVGLPFYYFKKEVFTYIETLLGNNKPIKPSDTERKDRILNFQTEIDLKKPLKAGFFIGETRFVEFKYKNIGDFCYNCGIIGHVKSNCDKVTEERVLNATSKTPVYGPWLRLYPFRNWYWMLLKNADEEKEEDVKECEKTLPYPQFFVQLKFNVVAVCNSDSIMLTTLSHNFRFPCSYIDEHSTNLTTSKACEVIESEIRENNTSFPLVEFEDIYVSWPIKKVNGEKSNTICSLVEYLNEIRKNSEDKWLPFKLEISCTHRLTAVDYQTMLNKAKDLRCVEEIERKMSELINKKVEEQYHLDCVSLWEIEKRDALADIGYFDYPYLFDVTARAEQAMREATEMVISSITCPIPAEREVVEKLERKKVIGSEIDRLDPCAICSQEMFLAEEVIVLPCSHVFHGSCVHKWFRVGHKCPLCGFELPCTKQE